MVESQEHTLKPKQIVRLKDGFDDMYDWARVGAQGRVKDVTFESQGYPLAYIEWDKDHWTYEGQEDGWFFQSHFKVVEDSTVNEEIDPKLLAQIVKAIKAAQGEDTAAPEPEEDKQAEYVKAIELAKSELEDTEAFALITVTRKMHESGVPVLIPSVVSYAKGQTGVVAVHNQLAVMMMGNYQMLLDSKLQEAYQQENDDES